MANTGQPNSGGSQFFMIYGDGELPPQYTAFGSITPEGLQVLDTIAKRGSDGSLEPQPRRRQAGAAGDDREGRPIA